MNEILLYQITSGLFALMLAYVLRQFYLSKQTYKARKIFSNIIAITVVIFLSMAFINRSSASVLQPKSTVEKVAIVGTILAVSIAFYETYKALTSKGPANHVNHDCFTSDKQRRKNKEGSKNNDSKRTEKNTDKECR